jgi:hypothetical protein
MIEQTGEVIRPDGTFRRMTYAKNSWKDRMVEAGLHQVGLGQSEARSGRPVATTYNAVMLQELWRDCFEAFEIRQAHIFP